MEVNDKKQGQVSQLQGDLSGNYGYEKLSDTLEICVSKQHRFGTDAFLLSQFAGVRRKDKAIDLGTGCGIVALLWFRYPGQEPKVAYGVDIQEQAIDQLNQTIKRAGLEGKMIPVHSDLKELKGKVPYGYFDVVTCNPPYKAAATGILSEADSDAIARHEIMCSIYDIAACAGKLLQFGGRMCVCQRPERLLDTMDAMRKAGIEPKRLRFVQKHGDTAPWLFLLEGRRGGKPYLKVEAPLIVQGENGEFSRELLEIYGMYNI